VTYGFYVITAGPDLPLSAQLLLGVTLQMNANSKSLPRAPCAATTRVFAARALELTCCLIASAVERWV